MAWRPLKAVPSARPKMPTARSPKSSRTSRLSLTMPGPTVAKARCPFGSLIQTVVCASHEAPGREVCLFFIRRESNVGKVTSDKVMGDELGGRSLTKDKDRRQESEFRSQKLRMTRFESFKRDWICHRDTENTEREIPKSK